MELEMDRQLIQGIWGYHWWGNRTHFDEVAALGEETARQEVGKQFSVPTLKGMLPTSTAQTGSGSRTADLRRHLDYKSTGGKPFSQPLWQLLQHVVNHATHHRSEVATMVTMIKGSPKSTDMVFYYRQSKL